jgi:hypothetical protein
LFSKIKGKKRGGDMWDVEKANGNGKSKLREDPFYMSIQALGQWELCNHRYSCVTGNTVSISRSKSYGPWHSDSSSSQTWDGSSGPESSRVHVMTCIYLVIIWSGTGSASHFHVQLLELLHVNGYYLSDSQIFKD